jgi:hypothetical protein
MTPALCFHVLIWKSKHEKKSVQGTNHSNHYIANTMDCDISDNWGQEMKLCSHTPTWSYFISLFLRFQWHFLPFALILPP